jgi:hypothetical protein
MATRKDGHGNHTVLEEGASVASRRDFLKTAMAVSALPIVAGVATDPADAAPRSRTLALYRVIFDERFPGSRAFADRARKLGVPAQAIRGDVTALWLNDLRGRWQASPAAIAGLTAPSALFCLERLAWDHGMRVAFHAEHRHLSNGAIEHFVLSGERPLRPTSLDAAGTKWIDQIAELVTRYPFDRASRGGATSAGLPRTADDKSVTLASWIIAPVKKT